MTVDFGDLNLPRLATLLMDASGNRALDVSRYVAAMNRGDRPDLLHGCEQAKRDADLLLEAARAIITAVPA